MQKQGSVTIGGVNLGAARKSDARRRQQRHAVEGRSCLFPVTAIGYLQMTEVRRGDPHRGGPTGRVPADRDVAADDAEALQRGRHDGVAVEAASAEAEAQERRARAGGEV